MNRLSALLLTAGLATFGLCAGQALATETPTATAPAPDAFDAGMQAVLAPYLEMQDRLAADSTEGVKAAAEAIIAAAAKLDPKVAPPPHTAHYAKLPEKLTAGAQAVRDAQDLAAARAAFKALSKPMGMWASMARPADIDVVYCSMAKGGWIQKTGPVRNPYHGSEMLACGEVVQGPGAAKK